MAECQALSCPNDAILHRSDLDVLVCQQHRKSPFYMFQRGSRAIIHVKDSYGHGGRYQQRHTDRRRWRGWRVDAPEENGPVRVRKAK